MKTDKITPETIKNFVPNLLTEVEGERSLFDKLSPFLESARLWLESEYLGPDDFLSDIHNDYALKILVAKAFADAVPSLDLVVTPTGMGVISTDNMAPASKERVERLIASLNGYVRSNISVLVDVCRQHYPEWRSGFGRKFCDIFLYEPNGVKMSLDKVLYEFDYVRPFCVTIEAAMADFFFGHSLMTRIRSDFHAGTLPPGAMDLIQEIRMIEITLIGEHERYSFPVDDRNRLWYYCRRIISRLFYFPEYKEIWEADKGSSFKSDEFHNDIKGSFYF